MLLTVSVEEFVFWGGDNAETHNAKQELIEQINKFNICISAKGFFNLDRGFIAAVSNWHECYFHYTLLSNRVSASFSVQHLRHHIFTTWFGCSKRKRRETRLTHKSNPLNVYRSEGKFFIEPRNSINETNEKLINVIIINHQSDKINFLYEIFISFEL